MKSIDLACVVGGRPRPEIQWMREIGKFSRIYVLQFCVLARKLGLENSSNHCGDEINLACVVGGRPRPDARKCADQLSL